MVNTRYFLTAFGFVIVTIAGVLGWLGFKSLEDIKSSAREEVRIAISQRLSEREEQGKTLAKLIDEVSEAKNGI